MKKQTLEACQNDILVSMVSGSGKALAFALFNLQERGRMFIGHGTDVYEGMIIGIHNRTMILS